MRNKRGPSRPEARACKTKSELRSASALVESTRADAAHPSKPRTRNVIRTETSGETFSGKRARTVISRNNQGKDRNKISERARQFEPDSAQVAGESAHQSAASAVETNAAAGASRSEMRVP